MPIHADTLRVDFASQTDARWFTTQGTESRERIGIRGVGQRRALYFASATADDLAAHKLAVSAAAELSVAIGIAPLCKCPAPQCDCSDRHCWEILDHPYGPYLRVLDGGLVQLETRTRSSPNVHARLWCEDDDWRCSDGLGAEWPIEHVEGSLAEGELPE